LDIRNITGSWSQDLSTNSSTLQSWIAIHLITASEIAGVCNLSSSTKETSLVVNTRDRPLVRESANLPFDPSPNINKQTAQPGYLGLKGGMVLKLLHELLVERPEMNHFLLQRGRMSFLLLPVLPDGGSVAAGALLGGIVLGG
jgi:hypothetical protein